MSSLHRAEHFYDSVAGANLLKSMAERLTRERKLRTAFLPPEMLGEFPWDWLLLLCQQENGWSERQLASELNAPLSVVKRWLAYLEAQDLCEFRNGDGECRGLFRLSSNGRTRMRAYFGSVAAL